MFFQIFYIVSEMISSGKCKWARGIRTKKKHNKNKPKILVPPHETSAHGVATLFLRNLPLPTTRGIEPGHLGSPRPPRPTGVSPHTPEWAHAASAGHSKPFPHSITRTMPVPSGAPVVPSRRGRQEGPSGRHFGGQQAGNWLAGPAGPGDLGRSGGPPCARRSACPIGALDVLTPMTTL